MRTRGRGLFHEEWYSICSTHYEHDWTCLRCAAGVWRNVWAQRASSLFFKLAPGLWRWWANRGAKRRLGDE